MLKCKDCGMNWEDGGKISIGPKGGKTYICSCGSKKRPIDTTINMQLVFHGIKFVFVVECNYISLCPIIKKIGSIIHVQYNFEENWVRKFSILKLNKALKSSETMVFDNINDLDKYLSNNMNNNLISWYEDRIVKVDSLNNQKCKYCDNDSESILFDIIQNSPIQVCSKCKLKKLNDENYTTLKL